jgi:probable addiction module antidote protein
LCISLEAYRITNNDPAAYIAKAPGAVARAKGMTGVAAETGLSREQLYRLFNEGGNPTLKSTLAVMKASGIELTTKIPQ